MSMVFVLLPLSIILGGGALVLFLWALRNGQFDDLKHLPTGSSLKTNRSQNNIIC